MITDDRMIAFINSFDKGNTPFLNQIEQEAKEAYAKEGKDDCINGISADNQPIFHFVFLDPAGGNDHAQRAKDGD